MDVVKLSTGEVQLSSGCPMCSLVIFQVLQLARARPTSRVVFVELRDLGAWMACRGFETGAIRPEKRRG
jgi:hypothetical protein